jgi:hydrogenase nickel incorporation protein HypA/HybF
MHELSIAQSLLEAALTEARRAGATRITRVSCRIGDLRQIDSRLMAEAFEAVRCGTLCDQAELAVEKSYVQARCRQCERCFEVRDWDWQCPACKAEGVILGGGDELELVSIEAEIDP